MADLRQGNAEVAAEVLRNAGFEVSTATVDVSSRESVHALVETATGLGEVTGVIHAAGVSPSQAPPAAILAVDLYGTAMLLEEFGNVIARGGAGVVISSQSGHRLSALTAEQDAALATTPADELLALPMLGHDQVTDSMHAYQLAKRGNSLRVMAEAVRWGKRSARVNTISPGIIFTPLAKDELTGPHVRTTGACSSCPRWGAAAPRTRSRPSARSSWAPTAGSSPAAMCSWMVASPPPTSSANSRHGNGSIWQSSLPCLRWINRTAPLLTSVALGAVPMVSRRDQPASEKPLGPMACKRSRL